MDIEKFESERLQTVEDPVQSGRVDADDPQARVPTLDADIDIVECTPKLATHLTHDRDVEYLLAHGCSSKRLGCVGSTVSHRAAELITNQRVIRPSRPWCAAQSPDQW